MAKYEGEVKKAAQAAGYKGGPSGWIGGPDGQTVCQGWATFAVLFAVRDGALVPRVLVRRRGLLGFDAYAAKENGERGDWLTNGGTAASAYQGAAGILARRDANARKGGAR